VNFSSKKQKNIKNENGNIVNNIPKKFLKNHQIWGKKKGGGNSFELLLFCQIWTLIFIW
jgi:hypothetical protein